MWSFFAPAAARDDSDATSFPPTPSASGDDSRVECARDAKPFAPDALDDLNDLNNRPQGGVFFIAFSGGGVRAAVLAANTMVLLERRYAAMTSGLDDERIHPFAEVVDAYSSVSGGSLYAYMLALTQIRKRVDSCLHASAGIGSTSASPVEVLDNYQWVLENTGAITAAVHLTPWASVYLEAGSLIQAQAETPLSMHWLLSQVHGILGYVGPLRTLFTNDSYLNVLAQGLNLQAGLGDQPLGPPERVTLGLLGDKPRFFFNTTSLETRGPLILTQRMLHVPTDRVYPLTARLDVVPPVDPRFAPPLPRATMLEDLNSSPSKFPLAYAAMASAAFPIGLDPLKLRQYGFDPSQRNVYPTADEFNVSDGGVWDNSGLITLTDMYKYLRDKDLHKSASPGRLVLVSVNAETEVDKPQVARETGREQSWLDTVWENVHLSPLRLEHIYTNVNLIHFTNKRRAENAAVDSLRDLITGGGRCETGGQDVGSNTVPPTESPYVFYFPISLTQLSKADPNHLGDGNYEYLFDRLQQIGTNFQIGSDEATDLAKAANVIVTTPQGDCRGWFVGPQCNNRTSVSRESQRRDGPFALSEVQRLDEALTFALLRNQLDAWPKPGAPVDPLLDASLYPSLGPLISEFCRRTPKTEQLCPDRIRRCEVSDHNTDYR